MSLYFIRKIGSRCRDLLKHANAIILVISLCSVQDYFSGSLKERSKLFSIPVCFYCTGSVFKTVMLKN